MGYATKDLRMLINELTVAQLTAEDGGQVVLKHIVANYKDFTDKKLPKATEDLMYDKKGERQKGESFLQYCSRKKTLIKEWEKHYDPEQFKGYLLYRGAHLSDRAQDAMQTWTKNDMEYAKVEEYLKKFDRPQAGGGFIGYADDYGYDYEPEDYMDYFIEESLCLWMDIDNG